MLPGSWETQGCSSSEVESACLAESYDFLLTSGSTRGTWIWPREILGAAHRSGWYCPNPFLSPQQPASHGGCPNCCAYGLSLLCRASLAAAPHRSSSLQVTDTQLQNCNQGLGIRALTASPPTPLFISLLSCFILSISVSDQLLSLVKK